MSSLCIAMKNALFLLETTSLKMRILKGLGIKKVNRRILYRTRIPILRFVPIPWSQESS